METLLKNSSIEMLREYYYDLSGGGGGGDFTKEEIIKVILKLSR